MQQEILETLQDLASDSRVEILFACESGSRAWGFPSPDSDYDARFIFIQKSENYLSVSDATEHLSLLVNDEFDICGWDLRKVLRLLHKSNCTPYEWLQSPIVYAQKEGFRESIMELLPTFFNARRQTKHYLGMAHSALSTMQGGQIGIKKLFYVLRPLLAANWINATQAYPPMTIQPLLDLAPPDIRRLVDELIALKAESIECMPITVPAELKFFIGRKMQYLSDNLGPESKALESILKLDRFFQNTLR